MYGKNYLKNKLNTVRPKVITKYEYYENDNKNALRSIAIPQELMQHYRVRLNWCGKAVDLLCDRLSIKRFKDDFFNMQTIYADNNADILFGSAIKGALISSCDFIYLLKDGDRVKMEVINGSNATGILDETTALLKEGYAVLKRDPENESTILQEAYFTPEYTEYTDYEQGTSFQVPTYCGKCLLVPIINNPKIGQKSFGHSRISKSMMNIQDDAERLSTETKILAEINSWPQKWITGLAEGTEIDTLKATFSSLLRFDKDDDGDRPQLGQFTQMSFNDHIKLFDQYVSEFSGMSALTRDDLGFVTENPSSAESKKAALESLRVIAGKCQRDLSVGFINAGFVAASLRDEKNYARDIVKDTSIIWRPLVEPDASTLSSIGDGVIKINQAIPGFFNTDNLSDLLGIEASSEVGTNDGLFDFETGIN